MSTALHLYTDFVCPFCFIAEQSSVPRLLADFDLTLDWHGFELHPGTPSGGLPLSSLFPGADLELMHERTRAFAAGFGVRDFRPPNRLQSSRRALAVAEFARVRGTLTAFRGAVFEAHWRQGMDLEADETLEHAAQVAELSPSEALSAADDAEYLRRVDERQSLARRQGVTGIPTFVIEGQKLVGCQPYDVLAATVERALSR